MKRLLIAALLLTNNAYAQTNDLFKDNTFDKKEVNDPKSELRTQEFELGLQSKIAEEKLRILSLEKQIKKEQFILDNVPPEYIGNEKAYYDLVKREKMKTDLLPTIGEGSQNKFPVETYTIDQIEMIPIFEERKEPKPKPQIEVIKEAPKPKKTAVVALPNEPVSPIQVDDDLSQLEAMLSPEEFERVKRMYKRQSAIKNPKPNKAIKIKAQPDFEITVDIDGVYIFGIKKSADITLNVVYQNGTSEEKKLKDVKEGEMVRVFKDKVLIETITFREVILSNMNTGDIYIGSKNLR
ncbi:hypothetical protein H5203_18880 [Pseudoalteromonas sp. SG41-1]|uniref:hypothetical protein n=1 Tax=Pseudoalteromonas sp. SG41-1 TaxID=2760979 RepID=UPI0016001A9D|nr:hypothetical protein [Pseudoalteromonas sp. SG41-1]MBB1507534.1 hypothetical protein [Pseudoalteromonas sp. SG41-1]